MIILPAWKCFRKRWKDRLKYREQELQSVIGADLNAAGSAPLSARAVAMRYTPDSSVAFFAPSSSADLDSELDRNDATSRAQARGRGGGGNRNSVTLQEGGEQEFQSLELEGGEGRAA